MSRPRKQPAEQRHARLSVRVTPAELAQVERQASVSGLSAAEFVRRCALGRQIAPRRTQVESSAVVELIRVGNNLNQMARATNSGRLPFAAEMQRTLSELQAVLRGLTHQSECRPQPEFGLMRRQTCIDPKVRRSLPAARSMRRRRDRNHREGAPMVPDIAGKGHSFKGAMQYYLHDKRQPGDAEHPTTSERVAWTEIRNLPVDDPHFATRLMIETASHADELKRQAGVKATGRRSSKAVYAFSLSWHPDEAAGLNKSEMIRAADEALAALDASHLQCVIVCHRDQPHPHVHCIVNRVNPDDGRMAVLSKDRERLSKWAHGYERERGPLLTPKRAERYGPEAERERNQQERADMMAGHSPHRSGRRPSPEAGKIDAQTDRRAMLAQLDAAQRERHKSEWQALGKDYRQERKAILDRHASPKAIIAEHRKERRIAETVLRDSQAREIAAFDARNRSFFGRVRNALDHAREIRPPEQGRFAFMKTVASYAFSPAKIRQHLTGKHKAHRDAFTREGKAQLNEKIAVMKQSRQLEFTGLTARHEKDREALITRQDAEKAKMKEAWRAAPQPERGKRRSNSRIKDSPDRNREVETTERKRQRRARNRDRGRSR